MNQENALSILEERLISNIDYSFISELKLPYHNIYYLVCFVEVLHRFLLEGKNSCSVSDAVESINHCATEIYNNTNISSVFQPYFE
jgi:hypothetical protein